MLEKVENLMDNKEAYENMKKKSVEIFEKKFTAEIYARNIEAVYEDVYNGR